MPFLNPLRHIRFIERARPWLLLLAVLAASAILLGTANSHQPIVRWLFWPYAGLWALTLVWALACLSIGHAVLQVLPAQLLRVRERLVFDFAVGTLAFAVLLFVAGLFGWLRGPFAFVFPLLLAGIGAPNLFGYLRGVLRHSRQARRHTCVRPSPLRVAALVLGTLGLALVYLTIMVPDNAAFDALTYHLAMAEGWAAAGRIGAFPEGWFPGTIPHLASWLYTWPFTFAPLSPFLRIVLAAHLEFFLFMMTLASTPLLVEALCPRRRAGLSWALYFLFPGLFLYDSSLGLAADHVLAFWAVPLALATRRTLGSWTSGRCALLGLMAAGAAMTKYQAIYLLVPVALVLFADGARLLIRRRRPLRFLWTGPVTLAVTWLLASAPHWLANALWYGNPVYPLFRKWFPWSHPWAAGWKGPTMDTGWTPGGPFISRLLETSKAVFTFSFVPHDWPNHHRDIPVFGFLFTLSLLMLPFVRGARRVWLLVAGTSLGVFIWYWTYHQDRYLQILLPWMVACTAAIFMLAWSSGRLVRIALALLVVLQLAWGGDVPFLPTHAMVVKDVPLKQAITLLSSTFRGEAETRFRHDISYFEGLSGSLPKKAVVLLHEEYLRFGLGRPVVGDSARWQGGIHYPDLQRSDRVFDLLKGYGATHIVWETSHSLNQEVPLSGELVFYDFLFHHGSNRRDFGRFSVVSMPLQRPAGKPPGPVLFLGCREQRNITLSELDATAATDGGPPPAQEADAVARLNKLIEKASFVVTREGCSTVVPPALFEAFTAAPRWGAWTPWVRN
jgi:hypothetical protein